jgi:dTMP kinase
VAKLLGKFITIEGIEGVGKTTARNFIEQYLKRHQVEYVLTREPGGTPIAEDVRQLLLKNRDEIMSPDTELLLLFAGRAQNISQVIRPALQRGEWVVSDRFTDASFAYQGGGRNIPQKHIANLADWVQGDLQAHLTLLLDAPVEIALKRIAGRGVKDRIENEAEAFFERVRQQYLNRAEQFSDRFRVIDATQDVSQVQQCIAAAIDPLINE